LSFGFSMLLNVELSTFNGVEDWTWSYVKCWAFSCVKCWAFLAWKTMSFLFKNLLHEFHFSCSISFICVQQFVVSHVWLYMFSLIHLCLISFHHYLLFFIFVFVEFGFLFMNCFVVFSWNTLGF
jgi:hypothetical protein